MAKRKRLSSKNISVEKVSDRQEDDGHVTRESDNSRMHVCIEADVIDCTVCFGPLRPPLFQCINGHTACSDCRAKLHNKCHFCRQDLGHSRCLAFEKVIESILVPCAHASYGCKMTIPYIDRSHEKTCFHAPCDCPITNCSIRASADLMTDHLIQNHRIQPVKSIAKNTFFVHFKKGQKLLALHGMGDVLFLLLNRSVTVESMALFLVSVSPSSNDGGSGFNYYLRATSPRGSYLSIDDSVACLKSRSDENVFLFVPKQLYKSGKLSLYINIRTTDPI